MSHHKSHTVTKHRWVDGVLHTTEHVFESLESAMNWCNRKKNHKDADTLKVITPDGEVAHAVNINTATDTYA
jgi:hypothetical protein